MFIPLELALGLLLGAGSTAPPAPNVARLKQMHAAFAPVELTADLSTLPLNERKSLVRQLQAAKVMDAIFLQQSWSGNVLLLRELAEKSTPLARAQLEVFLLNQGPWDQLDQFVPFIPNVPPRPVGGSFYPADSSKEALEAWMKTLPPEQHAAALGFFTVIRRGPDGKFVIVPYSIAYQPELARAAELLREAATLTTQPTLKDFLEKRATAFLSNDYYASDVAWMRLDATLEPTLGPYEVYEDGFFNAKAVFEAFITVRDEKETQKLARFSAELQDIENHLPIDPTLRNPKLGALAPIRVENSLYCSGDANRGVQTAAFNLPNDERIVKEMGSKRVMLKNVQEAKFKTALLPISKVALGVADQKNVHFDVFFTHILMHELMHGLGPHNLMVNGKPSTVRAQLEESNSAIEEAKADVAGLFAMQYLIDKGVLEKSYEQTMYTTYLASAFRSIRFGLAEAHGRGVALQLNYLLDAGAVTVGKDGRFAAHVEGMKAAIVALTRVLMTLQATGDHAQAQALLAKLGVVRPEVQRIFDRLKSVPVDIRPRFSQAERLMEEFP